MHVKTSQKIINITSDGLIRQNIVTVRLLALCPMLAVSVSVNAATLLGSLTVLVMVIVGFLVALLRPLIASVVRIPIFLVIVATIVGIIDVLLQALMPEMSRQLGIFLPLIITNCAVLARLEVFASKNSPLLSAVDGMVSGLGMLLALVILSAIRELLGTGAIAGIIDLSFFEGVPIAILPAGGFILFGFMLALYRLLGTGCRTSVLEEQSELDKHKDGYEKR